MAERVSNYALQTNSLQNIFRITEELFKTQQQIATGKRISKPSDDPAGIRDALSLRTSVTKSDQFVRNVNNNRIYFQAGESTLDSINFNLIRAKELAVQELGGLATAETRKYAVSELNQLISQTLDSANIKVKNQFIFGGTEFRTQPFEQSASGAVYHGNSEGHKIAVGSNTNAEFTLPGSETFGNDLNPKITKKTKLTSLNAGSGITPGSISITDRAGNSGTVTVNSSDTVEDLILKINNLKGSVTATVNAKGSGLQLTDGSSVISQALTVSENSGGNTAKELGILGQRDGNISGSNLNPIVTSETLISDLKNGNGLTLNQISISNGAASGIVTLSSAETIGDVINLINATSLNITASINSTGNSLLVNSNNSTTIAIVKNIGADETAEDLGLGGGKNVFTTLFKLRDALKTNDSLAILASLENLGSSQISINNNRAIVGAKLSGVEKKVDFHNQNRLNISDQLSNIEDVDAVKSISDLANLEFALQATLSATAKVLQPTLMDFLR
jgi:flagellar hook-associated protein 3 FlgL